MILYLWCLLDNELFYKPFVLLNAHYCYAYANFNLNCRYFKKISIPDMDRAHLPLEQSALNVAHANNTLIITVSIYMQIA